MKIMPRIPNKVVMRQKNHIKNASQGILFGRYKEVDDVTKQIRKRSMAPKFAKMTGREQKFNNYTTTSSREDCDESSQRPG